MEHITSIKNPIERGRVKFSIVIPAFNEAQYVGATVASCLKIKTPRNEYEIIVVDNNSKDDTSAVAKHAGADIVVVEKNAGTNFARQRGVDESHGEIIAFLDADSEAPADWLTHIERNLNMPGVASTSGPYEHGFTGWRKILDHFYMHRVMTALPTVLYALFRRKAGVMIGGNFAARRETINAIHGLPPLKFYGDDVATAMLFARFIGKVFFDPTLTVKSSPRRYAKGLFGPALRYALIYFKIYFAKEYNKKPSY